MNLSQPQAYRRGERVHIPADRGSLIFIVNNYRKADDSYEVASEVWRGRVQPNQLVLHDDDCRLCSISDAYAALVARNEAAWAEIDAARAGGISGHEVES